MEDLPNLIEHSEAIHKTNVLPLRWFANFCNLYPSSWALRRALREEDKCENQEGLSKAGHRWWKLYTIFDAPYRRWGTTHLVIDWELDE